MRYKLREEFFGGLIYDQKHRKYIYIDEFVLDMISLGDHIENTEYRTELQKKHGVTENELGEIVSNLRIMELNKMNIENVGKGKNESYLSAPLRIFYDITYECNLRCKHCFTMSGEKNQNELTHIERKRLIDEMADLGVYRLAIAGGEPFIVPDLFDFFKYARSKGIDISFTTNGTLINEEMIDRLNDFDLKTLTVSLDGGSPETHDYIRGVGQFSRVMKALDLLKNRYQGKVALKTTLMKLNMTELEKILQIGEMYGCSMVKLNCIREDGRAKGNQDLLMTQDDYIETIKKAAELHPQITVKLPLNVFDHCEYNYMTELGFGCFAGKESICMNPIGEVRPCSHFPSEFVAGNIRSEHLYSIWNHSPIFEQFRTLTGNQVCNCCEEYDYCRAGCRYRAFRAGDLNGIDPYCYLYKNDLDKQQIDTKIG